MRLDSSYRPEPCKYISRSLKQSFEYHIYTYQWKNTPEYLQIDIDAKYFKLQCLTSLYTTLKVITGASRDLRKSTTLILNFHRATIFVSVIWYFGSWISYSPETRPLILCQEKYCLSPVKLKRIQRHWRRLYNTSLFLTMTILQDITFSLARRPVTFPPYTLPYTSASFLLYSFPCLYLTLLHYCSPDRSG